MGIKTVRSFCDVPAGHDPAQGVVISLPPHTGDGDAVVRSARAPHVLRRRDEERQGVRAVPRGDRRADDEGGPDPACARSRRSSGRAADLFDRIGGGAGPGGLKAVAPAGREQIFVTVPGGVDQVSLLGEIARRDHARRARNRRDARPPGRDRQQPAVRVPAGRRSCRMRNA